jgi:hypothetical protein
MLIMTEVIDGSSEVDVTLQQLFVGRKCTEAGM